MTEYREMRGTSFKYIKGGMRWHHPFIFSRLQPFNHMIDRSNDFIIATVHT